MEQTSRRIGKYGKHAILQREIGRRIGPEDITIASDSHTVEELSFPVCTLAFQHGVGGNELLLVARRQVNQPNAVVGIANDQVRSLGVESKSQRTAACFLLERELWKGAIT